MYNPLSIVIRNSIPMIPAFLKKYDKVLTFTAYGNPFFTYKYKKTGLVETDAELLLDMTEKLLQEMRGLLLEEVEMK